MHLKAQKALPGSHVICDSICHSNQQLNNHSQVGFGEQLKEFFLGIFDTSYWPPRWHCGTWTDFHGWLYIVSDLFIWAAYFAIPFLLFRIINKRKDIPFPRIIWLFIAFILLCGTTHLIDAMIFWWPAYRLSATVRFITAVASIFTVFALYKILPMVYNLRTLAQLEVEIEERKKAEQIVKHHQVMQEAAEELMSRKDEFMSIASHELKTPITSLKASLQLVEKIVDKDVALQPVAPFVEKAVKQVNKLTDIVNELMDVTRIQAGRLGLSKTDFNLMDMIEECQEQCIAVNNKHTVHINGDPNLVIHADRIRLEQVVSNLLTNAFKYSSENGSIFIKFEKNNNKIKVAVTDNGIGIPENNLSNIFDRFYRVENTSKNFSGIGLGLYISSEIIKRHHGQIGAESTLGKGSTFWFII
ncbi:sensor histidine kinase [Mucilaginibacter sp. McL0603]|uniref:sensor histidine kinase n=1 Tax=Mucilaginibacter sp. McL0603 TaxID=3415670 RepID=UPI003CE9F84B